MKETFWCPGLLPWQWFRMCTRDVPDQNDPCNAPPCIDAKAKLKEARNRFDGSCKLLRSLNAFSKSLRQILAMPVFLIVALAIVATILGGPLFGSIAVLLWSLVLIFGLSSLLLPVVGKMAQTAAIDLAKASADVMSGIEDVKKLCPDSCRGDTSIPNCSLE